MTSFKKLFMCFAAALIFMGLAGCDVPPNDNAGGNSGGFATDADDVTDENGVADIVLSDGGTVCQSPDVSVDGNTVTIKAAGTYSVSGALTDGQIRVDADKSDKIKIILGGASVNSASSAALYVKKADKVTVTLKEDTQNLLTNGGEFKDTDTDKIDGAVFSKEDISFKGTGRLTINSEGGHGIVCKDKLKFSDGTYAVTAAKSCLNGKDCVEISGGSFTLNAGTDGIHSENSDDASLGYILITGGKFDIDAKSDGIDGTAYLRIEGGEFGLKCTGKGIKASGGVTVSDGVFTVVSTDDCVHSNNDVTVSGGKFTLSTSDDAFHADETLTVSGGEIDVKKSYEGLEGLNVIVSGGNISIIASDDGLNAGGGKDESGFGGFPGGPGFPGGDKFGGGTSNCSISISGGIINVNAGGDGVDSNGSLTVSGGKLYISGPTSAMNGALDYDGTAKITGGTVVAAGSNGMAQNFGASSTQGSILVNYKSRSKQTVTLSDSEGNVLISYTPEKFYGSVVVSCPELKVGNTYMLTACGETTEITLTSVIYGNGFSFGPFGGP